MNNVDFADCIAPQPKPTGGSNSFEESRKANFNSQFPAHYNAKGISPFDVFDANFNADELNGFDIGNVLKYTMRFKDKNGLEDLKKAAVYLNRIIERMEKENAKV